MRLGIILLAFIFGCAATALIRVAPNNASASNESDTSSAVATEFEFSETLMPPESFALGVTTEPFGETSDGRPVQKFVCTNRNGFVLELMDYGATIIGMHFPSAKGSPSTNVALSCNDMDSFEACTSYFGSTIGRYCNRIADGKFSIGSKEYSLATNAGNHHLHGGKIAFDKKVWQSETLKGDDFVGVRFTLVSKDGDEGYPGNVEVVAEYTLDDSDRLKMVFKGKTDAATHLNVCNHAYWNIGGATSGSVMEHEVLLNCDQVVEVDDELIPTGKLLPTKDNAFFDFTSPRTFGNGMKSAPAGARGYDHCFVINRDAAGELALVGSVKDPKSGRKMTIYSTQPGVQVYTSNHFAGQPASGGFDLHGAVCFETQHYPDSPNRPEFPSTLLEPGEEFKHTTIHQFSVE